MHRRSKVFFLVGFLLIFGSLGMLIFSRLQANRAAAAAAEVTAQLESVLPPRTPGITENFTNMEMPALSMGDQDFIGIIEVPAFQTVLPICSNWDSGKVSSFPCRFWGTVYDGSLIVGGADQTGQFDFLDQIQNEDLVLVTDMTGAQFSYRVDKIIRTKSAQSDILLDDTYDLTLFVRESRSLEYIIVRCTAD